MLQNLHDGHALLDYAFFRFPPQLPGEGLPQLSIPCEVQQEPVAAQTVICTCPRCSSGYDRAPPLLSLSQNIPWTFVEPRIRLRSAFGMLLAGLKPPSMRSVGICQKNKILSLLEQHYSTDSRSFAHQMRLTSAGTCPERDWPMGGPRQHLAVLALQAASQKQRKD